MVAAVSTVGNTTTITTIATAGAGRRDGTNEGHRQQGALSAGPPLSLPALVVQEETCLCLHPHQ